MSLTTPDSVNAVELYIERIELEGFLGFAKPRIKNLVATFDKKLQILNSTNGCGKTTFISELNPFPIDKTLFDEGGYKVVHIRFNNKCYKIVSDAKRNFLYDLETDTNLNDGGTITQHNALIKQLFNLTPFLWNAAMGSINFSGADKNLRRTWIETISGIDFNYPFATYKKITQELNSLKGAAKHVNLQITTEASKLLSDEEINKLTNLKDIYAKTVKELLLSRDTNLSKLDKDKLHRELVSLESKAKQAQLEYNKLVRFTNPHLNVMDIDSLRDYHDQIKMKVATVTANIENTIDRLAERSELLTRLDKGKGVDIGEIRKELRRFIDIQNDARKWVRNPKGFKQFHTRLLTADAARDFLGETAFVFKELITHCITVKDYQDNAMVRPFDKTVYAEHKLALDEYITTLNQRKSKLNHMEDNLDDITKQHKVDCPDCGSNFLPNGDLCAKFKAEIDALLIEIPKLELLITDTRIQVDLYEHSTEVRNYTYEWLSNQYSVKHRWYMDVIRDWIDEGMDFNTLSRFLRADEGTVYHLEVGLTSKDEIVRLETIIREYELVEGLSNVENLDVEVRKLEADVASLREERDSYNTVLADITDTGKLYNKHHTLLNVLKDALVDLTNTRTRYVKVLANVSMEAIEGDLQVQLANVTKSVNDNEILINLINSLQDMLTNTKNKIETFKVLEQAFNPSTGIIAEQLVGYVDAFTKQLTVVIAKLWGYPLTILPCSIEGRKGMDYQFPFTIGGKPSPDVSKGSKSQVAVIDLAVMLCTRISLGLNGLPLFLDEVGGGFDTVHNEKLAGFIRELLSDYGCSNVFLVHHDATVRNSLGPHDTIVFDGTQVIVEPNFNQNVEIIHYKEKRNENALY